MPEISKPYAYHKPSPTGLEKITKIRKAFSDLDRVLRELCSPGREQALAITNLEQAAMWSVKSVVFNDPLSEVESAPSREST